jgi:hypothetical protein
MSASVDSPCDDAPYKYIPTETHTLVFLFLSSTLFQDLVQLLFQTKHVILFCFEAGSKIKHHSLPGCSRFQMIVVLMVG